MKRMPFGVEAQLFSGEQKVQLDQDDGYAGQLTIGQKLELRLIVPAKAGLVVAMVQGQERNICPCRDRSASEDHQSYRLKTMVLKSDRDDLPFIAHKQSVFLLIRLNRQGQFTMWETGILAQGGKCFVHCQKTREGQCYRDGDSIFSPAANNWPSLEQLVRDRLGEAVRELPLRSTYEPPAEMERPPIGQARVQWFNPFLQYGFAILHSGQPVRLHVSQIHQEGRLIFLESGQLVQYRHIEDGAPGKPPQILNVRPV